MLISTDFDLKYCIFHVGMCTAELIEILKDSYTCRYLEEFEKIYPIRQSKNSKKNVKKPLCIYSWEYLRKSKIFITKERVLSDYVEDLNNILPENIKRSNGFVIFEYEKNVDYIEILKEFNFCEIYGVSDVQINSKSEIMVVYLDSESG